MNKKNYNNSDSASTGTLSINQVKVLNLEDFNSIIEEMNIDKNEFPTEQYYDNGFYYAVEKKNKINQKKNKQCCLESNLQYFVPVII